MIDRRAAGKLISTPPVLSRIVRLRRSFRVLSSNVVAPIRGWSRAPAPAPILCWTTRPMMLYDEVTHQRQDTHLPAGRGARVLSP